MSGIGLRWNGVWDQHLASGVLVCILERHWMMITMDAAV